MFVGTPCSGQFEAIIQTGFRFCSLAAELRFVATVTTDGRVKFVPAVYIFPETAQFLA